MNPDVAESSEASASFQPNEELIAMLLGMGISRTAAEYALLHTGNLSADAAASYALDNPELENLPPLNTFKKRKKKSTSDDEESVCSYKMVFVINASLGMKTGKIAAQVAHACLGVYRSLLELQTMNEALDEWFENGEKKIVLRGESRDQLKHLEEMARARHIVSHVVYDAGRTQVPSGSMTVLALFGEENNVDFITGELPLL